MARKNYEILKNDGMYCIYERNTDQYISQHSNYEKAKSVVKSLNSGSGFNGDTPSFFVKELVTL